MQPSAIYRTLLLSLGLALLGAAVWAGLRYRHDLDAARERVSGPSVVLQTRWVNSNTRWPGMPAAPRW
ncbi:MAG: hypothetical protein AB1455_03720 [Pseudomonadota bacterium]